MKRNLFLCFLLAMLFPFVAFADDSGSCGDNVSWKYIWAAKSLIISGSGAMHDYNSKDNVCPWESYKFEIQRITIENGVSNIGSYSFYECQDLTSVTIPSSVTTIGEAAFRGCISLKSIELTNRITFIGKSAFAGCSLSKITIPNSITSIEDETFRWCDLTSVKIPQGVTSIGYAAFERCESLRSIEFPNSLTTIGGAAFSYCIGLTSIEFPKSITNIDYCAFDGCSGLSTIEIPNSVTYISSRVFADCTGLTTIEIPNSVTTIDSQAFLGCSSLTSIEIPNSVTTIGEAAFKDCPGLSSIKIPNSVTTIGKEAFLGTAWQNSLPDGLVYIGNVAYLYNGEMPIGTTIRFREGTISISGSAFEGCTGLTSIDIPEGVASIGDKAFYGCTGLSNIDIPEGVASIGDEAFDGCVGLTNLTIPYSATSIGRYAFYGCTGLTRLTIYCKDVDSWFKSNTSIKEVFIGGSVSNIGNEAFRGCTGLTNITLSEGLERIGIYAFRGCDGLTEITLPSTIKDIESWAFYECSNIRKIISNIENPFPIASNALFSNIETGAIYPEAPSIVLYVPKGTKDLYAATDDWKYFGNIAEQGEAFVFSEDSIEYLCWPDKKEARLINCYSEGTTEIVIKSEITVDGVDYVVNSIGPKAFVLCSELTSVTIPKTITGIGDYAFYLCKKLSKIVSYIEDPFTLGREVFGNGHLYIPLGTLIAYYDAGWGGGEEMGETWTDPITNVNYLYSPERKEAKIMKSPDAKGNIDISAVVVNGIEYPIKSIAVEAFRDCTGLISVLIPEGVTYISNWVFSGCTNLTNVSIPSSVTTIYTGAFRNCLSLTSINIPEGVTDISYDAFEGCTGLTSVSFNCKEVKSSFTDFRYSLKEVFLGKNVSSIGWGAFRGCTELKSVTISEGVTTIGDYAFKGCSGLTNINIPSSVITIGDSAFEGCSGLTNINIPSSVTAIGKNPFEDCSGLISISLNCKEVGDRWFNGSENLKDVFLGENVEVIGDSAFFDCFNMTSLTLSDGISSIGNNAFRFCSNLTEVSIPSSVKTIGKYAFYYCRNLANATLNKGLSSIGDSAFYNCRELTSITIPDGVVFIGRASFENCKKMTTLTIPSSITTISDNAFSDCTNLTSVTIHEGVTAIGEMAFFKCSLLTSLIIPEGVTAIGEGAFYGCSGLVNVTIPNSLTSIGEQAFSGCRSLTGITIPMGVPTIGKYTFQGCSSLTNITIPSSVTAIGDNAFKGCSALTEINIPSSVATIGDNPFEDCSGLVSVSINCKEVGYRWFDGNNSIKDVFLGEGVENICDYAFYHCTNITSLTLSLGIEKIGKGAFSGCIGLTDITIPESVTSIDEWAFFGCEGLVSVTSRVLNPFVISSDVFYPTYKNAILYVPVGSKEIYKATNGWKEFKNIVESEDVIALSLNVTNEKGGEITDKVNILWYNDDGKQIGVGRRLNGVADSTEVYYSVILDENLGRIYSEVTMQKVIVGDKDENITCQLEKIGRVMLEGRVSATDIDKNTMTVDVKQMLNGKWEETYLTQTNEQGFFKVEVYDEETDITISGDGYFDATLHRDGFSGNGNVGTIPVNLISGFAIAPNITMQKAVAEGDPEEIAAWTDGLNNIDFTLTNTTKTSILTDFTVQNGNIIIKTGVDVGDEINLTAKSKLGIFADATTSFIIEDGANSFYLQLTELGGFDATYSASNNGTTVGYLYNNDGLLVTRGSYKGETLSLRYLQNGTYILVSMGNSSLLGNMIRLTDLTSTGLREGTDYITTRIEVVDGKLTSFDVEEVPQLDETLFYYTNKNTYFSVNKPSVTAGNFVSLSAHVDFKSEYADKVDNLTLYIDLPEGCEMVDNSILANRTSVAYTLNGSRLTMLLSKEEYESQVRFCIIPTLNKNYTITAMASFDVDGLVLQPIGIAQFEAKGLSLNVPKYVSKTNVAINGTARSHSEVSIYDNDVLIGRTSSKADGSWTAECELFNPYSHSFHEIFAKITTVNGMELTSETRLVEYDKNNIVPEKVTMLYYGSKTVFDLHQGTTSPSFYSYVPSVHDFTFLADFTRNDSTHIKNVNIRVLNSDGTIRTLPAIYDGKQNCWVATTKYESSSRLPQNVTVEYDFLPISVPFDSTQIIDDNNQFINLVKNYVTNIDTTKTEVLDANESMLVCKYQTQTMKTPVFLRIEKLNYDEWIDKLEKTDYFTYDRDGTTIYVCDTLLNENHLDWIWDKDGRILLQVELKNNNDFPPAFLEEDYHHRVVRRAMSDILGNIGRIIGKSVLNIFCNAGDIINIINEYNAGYNDYQNWLLKYNQTRSDQMKLYDKTKNLLGARCPDGSSRLNSSDIKRFTKAMDLCFEKSNTMLKDYKIRLDRIERSLINRRDATVQLSSLMCLLSIESSLMKGGTNNLLELAGDILGDAARGTILGDVWDLLLRNELYTSDQMSDWYYPTITQITKDYSDLMASIQRTYKKCAKKENDKDKEEDKKDEPIDEKSDDKPDFNTKGTTPEIDPSGYVYEAVTSNRLEGVTVTCYQKIIGEDMYGDPTEEAVVWNAEDFSQQNPLQTDATGFYQWDVPQGLWQVKYEKEGYETTYSDWLPVPPPQLDVNVGMKQSAPPTVKQMRGYESGITIELSKYMRPETMNIENITVTRNGSKETGGIEMVNAEKAPLGEETFVSKVKFVPKKRFNTSDNVVVTVHKEVESYCNVQMTADHVEVVKIEPEVKSIEVDSILTVYYQGEKELRVQVLPKEASVGKTLRVRTSSGMIASVSATEITINKGGVATLTLGGELPGGAVLDFSVDGTDVSATSKVKVIIREMVEAPIASIVSGEVFIGTEIELSCETEDVTIYYTLDGSCPCENSPSRKVYDGTPIVINENTIIKAMAVTSDGSESEVAEFNYTIIGDEDAIIKTPSTISNGREEYDTSGRKVGHKAKGVIIRKNDGTSRKVLIK